MHQATPRTMSETRIAMCWLTSTPTSEAQVEREVHRRELRRPVLLAERHGVDAATLHGQGAVVDDVEAEERGRLVGALGAHVHDHVAALVGLLLGRRANEVGDRRAALERAVRVAPGDR